MTAEEKLEKLLEEYKEASACGSTNMDFKTWRWCKDLHNPAAITATDSGVANLIVERIKNGNIQRD